MLGINNMKKLIILDKKEGETPLEALEVFRRKHKDYKDAKMTYAGRLDPMASGILLVLAGEEVKNKEKYLRLDKEYEFEVLFGFATDTYDILGKVVKQGIAIEDLEKIIKNNLKNFTGTFAQKYPIYSSKTVNGKQLFEYGREGIEVEQPEREVKVKSLKLIKFRKIDSKKLLANIEKRIAKVKGDFRQKEILKIWQKKLKPLEAQSFTVANFKIKCGSGTYVRGIANSLGEEIGVPALALSIKRTRVGRYSIPE
jgi:tRNA pseudouridine(55) synthase